LKNYEKKLLLLGRNTSLTRTLLWQTMCGKHDATFDINVC